MGLCPWNHLIIFIFGSGAALLFVGLIGTVAFNGKFGDDNKFMKWRYGWDDTIGTLTISNVWLAFIAAVLIAVGIGLSILHLPLASIIAYSFGFLSFLGTVISQVLSINWTMYGDVHVASRWSYYNNDDFREYIQNTGLQLGHTYTANEFIPNTFINATGAVNPFHENLTKNYDFDAFFVPYIYEGSEYRVPCCNISTWRGSFNGINPCNYIFNLQEDEYQCIGKWNPDNFLLYWCFLYRDTVNINNDLSQLEYNDRFKYNAARYRNYIAVDSFYAFYELNAIFLGLNCSGFVVLLVSIFLNMIVRPFDTKTKAYEELKAKSSDGASSGSGSKKSNRNNKGNKKK